MVQFGIAREQPAETSERRVIILLGLRAFGLLGSVFVGD